MGIMAVNVLSSTRVLINHYYTRCTELETEQLGAVLVQFRRFLRHADVVSC